jgi:hypothetical protein
VEGGGVSPLPHTHRSLDPPPRLVLCHCCFGLLCACPYSAINSFSMIYFVSSWGGAPVPNVQFRNWNTPHPQPPLRLLPPPLVHSPGGLDSRSDSLGYRIRDAPHTQHHRHAHHTHTTNLPQPHALAAVPAPTLTNSGCFVSRTQNTPHDTIQTNDPIHVWLTVIAGGPCRLL